MKTLLQGTTLALVFLITWLLTEGVYIGLTVVDAPIIATPLNLGVAAPVVLTCALLSGLTLLAWSRFLNKPSPVIYAATLIRRWLFFYEPSKRSRHVACLLGIPVLIVAWFALGFFVHDTIFIQIKTPFLAKTLFATIQFITAIIVALLSPFVLLPLERIVQHRAITPFRVLVALFSAPLLASIILLTAGPQTIVLLPWHFVLGPILALAATFAVGYIILSKPRSVRWLLPSSATFCIALGLLAAYMPVSWQSSRHMFVGQPTVASIWYGWLEKRLDYDNDGAIHLYAGNDCAPHDPDRGPHATEIINNGIDENCSGFDLKVNPDDYRTGQVSHPRPDHIAKRPNIILITTDALTFSHTSLGGYNRDTTPNLKKWAERATVFEHGFTLSSSTRLALPGLLAGQHNSSVAMKDGRSHPYNYVNNTKTLASLLKHHGYHTVFVPGDELFSK